jgi:two-component system, OmpR family, phosphate regulon sensor histidine kinase PhoR
LIFWIIVACLALAGALVFFYLRFIEPLYFLREALRRLAERDFRPILLNPSHGVFSRTYGHVRKIAELLKQLDQQVIDEEFSLRAILSSMVEGVLITDRAQRIRLINEPLHLMFDLRQSPINRTIMEVFRRYELQQAIDQTLFDGKPRRIEITQSPAPGQPVRHLEVYAAGLNPKSSKGRPLGAVVVFHDVSAVKNLESVRREFVANVSHEFRTPLAIINGYIETLLDGAIEDPAMAEKSLKAMHKNAQRLNLLIEDLLTISRMEHRSPHIDFQHVDLGEVLHRVIEHLEPAIAERNARVEVDWPTDTAKVDADPHRMEQVFANLLENALRHGQGTSEEIIRISGRTDVSAIEIVFADNGPGIPFEDQPHIFERFYRVHKDRSRIAGGTGLGLSIVKHIILAHGGEVSVESVPGQGAAFKIRLPLRQAPDVSFSHAV